MQDPGIWQMILLQVILIFLNAVFACAEIAVISTNDARIDQLASEGEKRAIRLARLTKQPARFLATIQVAITLSGFLASAFAADNFSDKLVAWFMRIGVSLPEKVLDTLAVVFITLILSYFTLVFGELVPKRLAMKKSEQLALAMSTLITFIAKLFAPIVWGLTASTNAILRILGIDPNAEDEEVSEEEIRMMVDRGNQKGVIDNQEREFIQNVFEFDDLTVNEFATHRTEMVMVWLNDPLEEWEKTINENRHTLYPVCDKSVDHVVGVLDIRTFFRIPDRTKEKVLEQAVRPAYFVPESVKADVLFKQMKRSRIFFAVVLDEYGGTFGIVTMKDLIEQLVGEMDLDGTEIQPEPIQAFEDGTWRIQGLARLDDVAEALGISLPEEDYETFGGYVFGLYGSIPEDGDQFNLETDALQINVLKIQDHKLEEAIVSVRKDPSGEDTEKSEK